MKHYTYRIWYEDGKSYIGVRSCHGEIIDDVNYVGSSKFTPNDKIIRKDILGEFASREDAIRHEVTLHEEWDVAQSEQFYNRSRQTSLKFDTSGVKLERTLEHNLKIKSALTGRKRSKRECLQISLGKTGRPHAPHTNETRMKISKANKGKPNFMKNKKHSSEDHLLRYATRTKYSDNLLWINKLTGVTENASCMEMGLKYGAGAKPTQRFRDIVKPDCKSKSYKGWKLFDGTQTSNCV